MDVHAHNMLANQAPPKSLMYQVSSSILSMYLTALHIVEPLNEADDSGLAAAGLPHQSQAASWVHLQTELSEDLHLRAGRVPEAHIAQLHTGPSLLWLSTCSRSNNSDETRLIQQVDGDRRIACVSMTVMATPGRILSGIHCMNRVWYVSR